MWQTIKSELTRHTSILFALLILTPAVGAAISATTVVNQNRELRQRIFIQADAVRSLQDELKAANLTISDLKAKLKVQEFDFEANITQEVTQAYQTIDEGISNHQFYVDHPELQEYLTGDTDYNREWIARYEQLKALLLRAYRETR